MFKNYYKYIIIVRGDDMQEILDFILDNIVMYLQEFGILFGTLIILLESIIPALPLGVFIAFNMMAFGSLLGFIISWISTIVGCVLSYLFFYKFISDKLEKRIKKHKKIERIRTSIKKLNFSKLVLIIALPFSPAFLINIACGLSKMDFKKFLISIIIGKLSIVYFWGFISKSLLESITDIKTIITVLLLLVISYILSKIVNKKLNIE